MFDAQPHPILQRVQGRAEVRLKAGPEGAAVPDRLRQEGSAKAILSRGRSAADPREVVFLNTAGGLTGGDRLSYGLDLARGLTATGTTQTAERAYSAAAGGTARMEVRLTVGAGGWLDWLPQETILFDGAALDRETMVDLAPGAGCLMLETVILGRHAMGEEIEGVHLRDLRRVERAGRPVWSEPLMLDTRVMGRRHAPAILGGARAFATLALIRPDAGDLLAPLQAVLDQPEVEAAASAMDGRLVLRMIAWDGLPLRRQIARALGVLRPGPLPRVWAL
ncbi:MAG TPA: urease accessory protein UreD [Paracoccaceae bacterium]|nr:urease accessory protein UreD [Paracoccaceae bacterium]HMO70235.1 urease accessory protein UreD [Paracoccaceae bacterium]